MVCRRSSARPITGRAAFSISSVASLPRAAARDLQEARCSLDGHTGLARRTRRFSAGTSADLGVAPGRPVMQPHSGRHPPATREFALAGTALRTSRCTIRAAASTCVPLRSEPWRSAGTPTRTPPMLLKTALPLLLVLLAGCDHRELPSEIAVLPSATILIAEAASVPVPSARQDTRLVMPRSPLAAPGSDVAPDPGKAGAQVARIAYVCPMHPEVVLDAPGACPKCNMKLEPRPATEVQRAKAHDHTGHASPEAGQ